MAYQKVRSIMTKHHTSVDITPDEVKAVQSIAAKLGYIQRQGGGAGLGSMAQLMRAIASGEVEVKPVGQPKETK
jgi:hypothetical protein